MRDEKGDTHRRTIGVGGMLNEPLGARAKEELLKLLVL